MEKIKIGEIEENNIYIDEKLLEKMGIENLNTEKEDTIKKIKKINKTIIIDPGHGGKDPGATDGIDYAKGDNINTFEKNLNLKFSLGLANRLKSKFNKIILTRDSDKWISLKERTDLANKTDAVLFLSIHFNAYMESSNGIETFKYTKTKNPISIKCAENIQNELIKTTKLKDRGVKEANFWVLKHTKMAAVLVELGFITNNKEEKFINTEDYCNKVIYALEKALIVTLF